MPYNAGSFIKDAEIMIADVTGVTYHAHTGCDGSSVTVFDDRKCQITTTDLTLAPFNLIQGSSILAKTRFLNEIGWSKWSHQGNPVSMQTVPKKPTKEPTRIE